MKIIRTRLAILSAIAISMISCMNSNDAEVTTYDDIALSNFSITTIKRVVSTKNSAGEDTTYTVTMDASSYLFTIDQLRGEVYNIDSLPYSVNPSRVLCTVTTRNGGSVFIKHLEKDTLTYITTTDSLDFSVPRQLEVFPNSGDVISRKYTVTVNVHKEEADTFKWSACGTNSTIAAYKGMQLVDFKGTMHLFASNGTATLIHTFDNNGGNQWNAATAGTAFAENAYQNVAATEDSLFILSDHKLYATTDGLTWEEKQTLELSVTQLAGATGKHIYLISSEGKIFALRHSADTEPQECTLDGSSHMLPAGNVRLIAQTLNTNKNIKRLTMIGNRAQTDTPPTVVWGATEQQTDHASAPAWAYYTLASDNKHTIPFIENIQTANYADTLLAVGGNGIGNYEATPFDKIYTSRDGGITWHATESIPMPEGFATDDKVFAMTVDSRNRIWIVCGGTGQTWRGRHNKLGWQTPETTFTK